MFQIDVNEIPTSLKSQIATLNDSGNKRGLHIKKMPYVFTEQGIYMLATVLKGELAHNKVSSLWEPSKKWDTLLVFKQILCKILNSNI